MAKTQAIHKVITLDGTIQNLAAAAGLPATLVRVLSLQPGGANANAVFIGGATVSSTDYGVRLPASSGGIPSAPWSPPTIDDDPLDLSDIYVTGTAAEKLHLFMVMYV